MADPTYREQKLAEIPRDVLHRAVEALSRQFPEEVKQQVRAEHAKDPDGWASIYHFGWGMQVRNFLRGEGLKDEMFPDKNLDDYYIALVEIACGARPMPPAQLT